MRIISLLPGATEMVCELGLGAQLVGVSADSDWPRELSDTVTLRALHSGSGLPSARSGVAAGGAHSGLSVHHFDGVQLTALRPDLILTQERCAVCMPRFDDEVRGAKLLSQGPLLVSLEPESLGDVLDNLRLIGTLAGERAAARAALAQLEARIERVRSRGELVEARPRTLCMAWLDPPLAAGGWVPEMVEWAGGETFGEAGEPPFEIDWPWLEWFNPEVLVLMPLAGDAAHTAVELDALTASDAWSELTAVKRDRVYLVQGAAYFERPGPRLVTGLEILAKALHPKLFADLGIPPGTIYKLGR